MLNHILIAQLSGVETAVILVVIPCKEDAQDGVSLQLYTGSSCRY
jgi:hypothetical protein